MKDDRHERAWELYNSKPVGNLNKMLNQNDEVRSFDKSVWKELRNIKELLQELNGKIK